jgi:hypothetical protein
MRSTTPMCAASAGTKLPICAISTINAVCLKYTDLPAILGPVMIWMRCAASMSRSLEINGVLSVCSTTGCRAPVRRSTGAASNVGERNVGARRCPPGRRSRPAAPGRALWRARRARVPQCARKLPEQPRFQFGDALFGVEDEVFVLLQLRRDVALGVDQVCLRM